LAPGAQAGSRGLPAELPFTGLDGVAVDNADKV